MAFYIKKPVKVEAFRFNCELLEAQEVLADWAGGRLRGYKLAPKNRVIQLDTRQGEVEAAFGDWIIRGIGGEFYPCPDDVFVQTYDIMP
jgi:hypothetical protein